MPFLKLSKFFLVLSVILVAGSLVLLVYPGPRLSIEFTGGTLMEFELLPGKTKDDLLTAFRSFNPEKVAEATIAVTKTGTYFLRTGTLTNEEHKALALHLQKTLGEVQELQYTTIGPTVGASLERHAVYAILAASAAIIVYLAFAFRKMPRHLSPWSFGVSAVIALIHDLAITAGIFTMLSYVTTFQVDTLFVSALLSIMGHSVSDTIVIFDRARDNLFLSHQSEDFATVVIRSLRQSLTRSINMGVAVLTMLFALFFLGAESIRWFILTLIIGTVVGAYSSYFIATPIVILWRQYRSPSVRS